MERKGLLTLGDQAVIIIGPDIQPGQMAPSFTAQTGDWEPIRPLEHTSGQVRILAAMPSLETSVCDRETRRFNEEAAGLGEQVAIMVISADLPYTQSQWCGAAGVDQVMVVSDHMDMDFGRKYGCLVKERRILRRAVFVVDRRDRVVYADYMPTLGAEPEYEEVLQAARDALVAD